MLNASGQDYRFITLYAAPSLAVLHVPQGTESVLDVGCGTGTMAAWLKERGMMVDGVSWNPIELQQAAPHCRTTIQCDLSEGISGLEPESYDFIICSHILEHIAYPQKLLRDLHNALKASGTIVVVIPNVFFWFDRLKLLRGVWRYESSGTFDYTHLRWYTKETMIELLEAHSFALEGFHAYGWFPMPGLRHITGKKLREWLNNRVCRWFPGLFGQQLLFLARKSCDFKPSA